MTKTQIKDATRNIGRNFVSYISILLITMLSIATYMGVSSASVNLENGANDFYKNSDFYDFEIISTLLLSENDIAAIEGLDSVESVAPFYYANAGCENNGEKENVSIISGTGDICKPTVLSGKEPAADGECMIEDRLAEKMSYNIGDSISFYNNDEAGRLLTEHNYTITGIFQTPIHIKPSIKDNSYVIVPESSFNTESLRGGYMRVYVRIKDRADGNYFSDAYLEKKENVKHEIENLAADRTIIRDAEVRDYIQSGIDDFEKALSESKEKLDRADASITDAEKKIQEGDKKLAEAKKELEELKTKLEEGQNTLAASKVELDEAENTLASSKVTLDNARAVLDEKNSQLIQAKNDLDVYDAEISDNEKKIIAAAEVLNGKKTELDNAKQKLDETAALLEKTFFEAENSKSNVRNAIKEIAEHVMEISGVEIDIDWSEAITDFDINTSAIEIFNITKAYGVNILTDDIKGAVTGFIESLNIKDYYDDETYAQIEESINDYLDEACADGSEISIKVAEYRGKINEWNTARQSYLEFLEKYNSANAEYEEKYAEYLAAKEKVEAARQAWNEKNQKYNESLAAYQSAEGEYNDGYAKYQYYRSLWEEKNSEYQEGLAKYNEGCELYDQNTAEYDKGLKKLAEYEDEFKKNKDKYEKGVIAYEEGEEKLNLMKEELNKLSNCEWIITSVEANVGYKHMGMTVDSLQNLGNNFTILFVIIASLIIYATIARIINEQHKLVGTTKAFGFYFREILAKYMLLGLSGLLIGLLLGFVVSFGFQKFALSVFVQNYVLPEPPAKPVYSVIITVIIAALAITLSAILLATVSLLKKSAVELLMDSSPEGVKGVGRDKYFLSLFQRLILRNIISDKMRVIVTIASIASCTALINIGFTMKYDFAETEKIEYDQRLRYDYNISYDTDSKDSSIKEAEDIYNKYNADFAHCMSYYAVFKAGTGSEIVEMTVADLETVQNFYDFTDPKGHKKVLLSKDGVFLKSGYADSYGIHIGDPIIVMNSRGVEAQAVIAGFYENYIGQKLYMDTEYYKEIFGEDPEYNKCMVKVSEDNNNALSDELKNCSYVHLAEKSDSDRESFTAYFKSINKLLILILAAAVLMAAIIISNLTFMYVNQKKVEIITMRINGFSFKEVRSYLLRESIFTTLLGIVIGLLGGSVLATSIIKSFEKPHLQLYKGINLKAWMMSALVAILFSLIINIFALRKVKQMKMTDIADVK